MTGKQALERLSEALKDAKNDPKGALERVERLQRQLEYEQKRDLAYLSRRSSQYHATESEPNLGESALGWLSGITPMQKLFNIFS